MDGRADYYGSMVDGIVRASYAIFFVWLRSNSQQANTTVSVSVLVLAGLAQPFVLKLDLCRYCSCILFRHILAAGWFRWLVRLCLLDILI